MSNDPDYEATQRERAAKRRTAKKRAQPRADGWISAQTSVPGDSDVVLCLTERRRYALAYFRPERWASEARWVEDGNDLRPGVIAFWRPLPAAPPSAGETNRADA